MHMKVTIQKYLNRRLNPMFFIGICLALLIFTVSAHAVIHQIGVEADKSTEALTGSPIIP
jgi:hypothetical protein